MTNKRSRQIAIRAAQSEAAFLLAWIRCIQRYNNRLRSLIDRYPSQRDTIEFVIRENTKEMQELQEERAYWLEKLDDRILQAHQAGEILP